MSRGHTPPRKQRQRGMLVTWPGFPMVYDLVMGLADGARARHWRRDIVQPAGGTILEIGAGTGLNFRYYRGDALVVATDPDRAMLERARAQRAMAPARIALIAADAATLPFRSGMFDTVVVGFAMCTIPTPSNALGEIRRVLRSRGNLRLLEHVRAENPVAAKLQDWLTPVWRRVAAGCHLDRLTVHLVAEAGFAIDSVDRELGGVVVKICAHVP